MFDPEKLVKPYQNIYTLQLDSSYLCWRIGTGRSIEILHLKANPRRKGYGTVLLKGMLAELVDTPPETSVYGFCLASNKAAICFYLAMGFDISPVKNIYNDGDAIVFSQKFKNLVERHFHEQEDN